MKKIKARKIFMLTGAIITMTMMYSPSVFADTTAVPRLNVVGTGQIKAAPDIAYLNVGVQTSAKDAETASAENTKIADRVRSSLINQGVDAKDIKTQNYYVGPSHSYNPETGESTITGYEVNNMLSITIRNINDVGRLVDAGISAGANSMNGLYYSIEDTSKYYDQLYQKAFEDAQQKASSISKAMGVSLTAPVTITENGYISAPVAYRDTYVSKASEASTMNAQAFAAPGELDLSVSISVGYDYR